MSIPEQEHPSWRELVSGAEGFRLDNLALRMLVTRLRLRTLRGDEASIREAIAIARAFFERNLSNTQTDLETIFGVRE